VFSRAVVTEFFGWRKFSNGREVGSLAGLAGTPFNTGQTDREQGISKAGNRWVRSLAIEIAWLWLRHQPDSEITKWYRERFDDGARRRKVGIVAVARRILVALWRFMEFDEVPAGAKMKAV
jgi:transposase